MTKPIVSYIAGVTRRPGRRWATRGDHLGLEGHRPGQDGRTVRAGCSSASIPPRRREDGRNSEGAVGRWGAPVRLVSGSGTILEAMIEAQLEVSLVASDRPCRGLEVARRAASRRCSGPKRLRRVHQGLQPRHVRAALRAPCSCATSTSWPWPASAPSSPILPRRLPREDLEHPSEPAARLQGLARRGAGDRSRSR